jgi:prepilin-type N-terminal cleavage/methylation domain-containing protein
MKSVPTTKWLRAGSRGEGWQARQAFTLIEIMVVVVIFGIVMAMGLPSIYRVLHKDSLRQMVAAIEEACQRTRAEAIMQGAAAALRFQPQEPNLGLAGAGGASPDQAGHRSDGIMLEMLDVNFIEYKDSELARVRFYPNGTSDEMTIVLRSDQNEYRKISLECTTGMTTVEAIR